MSQFTALGFYQWKNGLLTGCLTFDLIARIGFKNLHPAFTVVCKPFEAPLKADDYLPSVMTCANYLKMPDYSTKEVMMAKFKTAYEEGQGSFHLS